MKFSAFAVFPSKRGKVVKAAKEDNRDFFGLGLVYDPAGRESIYLDDFCKRIQLKLERRQLEIP